MDLLQGFDIDFCSTSAGAPGIGILEYAGMDEVDAESWEPAVDAGYVQRRAVSAQWHSLPFVSGTGSWAEDSNPDAQGQVYKNTITVFLPGDNAAIRGEIDRMDRRRFLLRLTGRDGRPVLLGAPEQPFGFESRFEAGSPSGDQRGHRCRFSGESLAKSPDYIPTF